MYGPSRVRRAALWLRGRLEALALRVDVMTARPYDPDRAPHLHLTDEEWAAFEEAVR